MKKTAAFLLILFIGGYEAYKTIQTAPEKEFLEQSDTQSKSNGARLSNKLTRLRLMTYNVENLFDTKDDPKKDDETFLPLSKKNNAVQKKCKKSHKRHWVKECLETNWTSFKLDQKMQRLAKVINAAKPDVLILQEVENMGVLASFNKKYLGYPTVVLKEGPDKRGIDVAVLSTLKEASKPTLHLQKHKGKKGYGRSRIKATRGILEAKLGLPNGEKLTVFGIHFPSQGSPTEARKQSIQLLNSLKKNTSGLVVAGGDFNIIGKESFLYKKDLASTWKVSHLEGCKKCKGTNYYHRNRSWSFLDALLFSKNFGSKTWKIDRKSIQVFNGVSVQNNRYGSPAKFEMGKNPTGVSDHWPVVAEIYL